ncbi:sensor histidine kinase [Desulfonatronum thioautotrophicum]|uniref:sensor histidine kinase n=1 Tax=Desulfonatronum thioautotrophicum TaxID=617001 RepID=UPI00069B4CB7|nr:sensor histidine kinase [Desulfonatronum thioautotrophicum]
MTDKTDDSLQRREQIEAALEAIRNEEVDAVVGSKNIVLLKLHRTEQALRQSEVRLRVAMDAGNLASWEMDPSSRSLTPCQRLKKMFGLSATDGKQFHDQFLSLIPEEDRIRLVGAHERALTTGEGFEMEFHIRRPDGEMRWLRSQVLPVSDEQGHPARLVGMVADITEHKASREALQASLLEKELLLREVHHRVKNNLANITALLEMQRMEVADTAASALLGDLEARVRSIALVHELLYKHENLARIAFQEYLDVLLQDLRFSVGQGREIRYSARAEEISFGIDVAIPCAMIVNELATNAIKHAFPAGKSVDGRSEPEIRVEVRKQNDHYSVLVADNGVGFPEEIDLDTTGSFGLRLVKMLGGHQLQGAFELDRGNGTRITFLFKERRMEAKRLT